MIMQWAMAFLADGYRTLVGLINDKGPRPVAERNLSDVVELSPPSGILVSRSSE